MTTLFGKGIAIHFKEEIPLDGYYVYEVEVENNGVSGLEYYMEDLHCSNGQNVLKLNEFVGIDGKTLLHNGILSVGEKVSGIVAFKRDITITDVKPFFTYDQHTVESYSVGLGG